MTLVADLLYFGLLHICKCLKIGDCIYAANNGKVEAFIWDCVLKWYVLVSSEFFIFIRIVRRYLDEL